MTEEKPCKICLEHFGQRPGETDANFRKRQTCSPECSHKAMSLGQARRGPPDFDDWTRLEQPWPTDLWYGDK
jgi:hypothetical protein